MEEKKRNYKMDNEKGALIFLVVLGHLLELCPGGAESFLYLAIYSFHMPAFAFCSGYFAKWNPKRLVQGVLYPYLCFQILYVAFDRGFLKETFSQPFTRPYWLLWYLMSIAFWLLLLPLISRYLHLGLWLLGASIALALFIGFVPWIGYRFSLSRTFVLFPFFLAGYLYRNGKLFCNGEPIRRGKLLPSGELFHNRESGILPRLVLLAVPAAASGLVLLWLNRSAMEPGWLYHALSYQRGNYTLWIRGLLLLNAGAWTLSLLFFLPDRRLPFLSLLGENTMAVYLLHGFFIKAAKADGLSWDSRPESLLLLLFISLVLCLLLGNPVTKRLFHFLFSGEWLDRLLC